MRETFPDKSPGDQLAASHVNDLNRIARQFAHGGGGSFQNSRGGKSAGLAPFVQRVVIITAEGLIPESSSSASSDIKAQAGVLWEAKFRYFDNAVDEWKTDEDAGALDLDVSSIAASLAIDDVISAYWDQQRGAWIPIVAGGEATVTRLKYKSMSIDSIFCEDDDENSFEVAKPYQLRRTPFDEKIYNDIFYTYISNERRTAEIEESSSSKSSGSNPPGVSDSEIQIIIPEYVVDDVLFVVTADTGVEGITLLDLNVDGRAWAREFDG